MACRKPANPIIQQGKWKGYREEAVYDAYWAEGYSLPKLPNYKNWKLQEFAIKAISDARSNIECLPTKLRKEVNEYHAVYGVGVVKDLKIFNEYCSNHSDKSVKKCRQCRARREAAKLARMIKEGTEISRGLLVRNRWVMPEIKEEILKLELETLKE